MLPAARLKTFQRRLLAWYRVHQRPLPWRRTRDPYKILVSEIMLQQTQVDRVAPKYKEFLQRYPTLQALAQAKTAQLRRVWYPLGYNVRPLRLRSIAQRTLREHQGRIPDSYEGLIAMDGIGRYTAGAVLSFAFKKDAPIVDTNVARLLSRYFGIRGGLKQGRTQRTLWRLAQEVIPTGKGHVINQAMMDFGAIVCTARTPRCPTCALRRTCRSYPFGWRPAGSLRMPPVKRIEVAFALIERRGKYLICQRPRGTHLAGYWEFPGGKREAGESWEACLRRELQEELGVGLRHVRPVATLHHRYPARRMTFKVFRCRAAGSLKTLQSQRFKWVTASRLRRFRFPPADQGLIDSLACPKRNNSAIIANICHTKRRHVKTNDYTHTDGSGTSKAAHLQGTEAQYRLAHWDQRRRLLGDDVRPRPR